jgi:hypothetical protein
MTYDPIEELAIIDRPVLAITGANDIQVDPEDVARIGRVVKGASTATCRPISLISSGVIPAHQASPPTAGSSGSRSTRGSSSASPPGPDHTCADDPPQSLTKVRQWTR